MVFVANLPARTRDEVWDNIVKMANDETRAVMVYSSSTSEQRLSVRSIGSPRRKVVNIEGFLVSTWLPRENPPPEV